MPIILPPLILSLKSPPTMGKTWVTSNGLSTPSRFPLPPAGGGGAAYDPATDTSAVEWLDAQTIVSVDGTDIAAWLSSAAGGGAGVNAVQITPANQPTYRTAQGPAANKPAVDFHIAGTRRFMTVASWGSMAAPYTFWVVFKWNSTGTLPLLDSTTGQTSPRFTVYQQTTYQISTTVALDSTVAVDTNWHIGEFHIGANASTSYITIDNGVQHAGNAGTGNADTLSIAQFQDGTGGDVRVGEIIAQNSTRTATSTDVYNYLKAKWGF